MSVKEALEEFNLELARLAERGLECIRQCRPDSFARALEFAEDEIESVLFWRRQTAKVF